MNKHSTTIIYGPPGTGKTFYLLNIVDELLQSGVNSEHICFVTFTRKAASEAKSRAISKFGLTSQQLPLFKTLHSLAFQQLNINRNEVMGINDYLTIARFLGIYLTAKSVQEDGTISGASKGDRLLFTDMMARSRRMNLKDYWELFPNEDISFTELERLSNTIVRYKRDNGKIDFIDMILRFITDCPQVGLKYLIVDEAQDLSTVQWDMVKKLATEAKKVYIAGDDDQAIFTWAGADVKQFMELDGDRIVLDKSYRVPLRVQCVANDIVSKIKMRVEKIWKSREEKNETVQGEVAYLNELSHIDMSKGTWLLLARNLFLLEQFTNHCRTSGLVYSCSTGSPINGATLDAIVIWEDLRKGKSVAVSQIVKVYDLMTSKVGIAYGMKAKLEREPENLTLNLKNLQTDFGLLTTEIWHKALNRIPEQDREYFLSALRQGEKLLKEPRIKISTIHGVKGGEADNVCIITDMARRTFDEFHDNPDAEHRVWYVAVTRARERLFIIQPKTNVSYTF